MELNELRLRIYLAKGSCWIGLVSPVKLDADALKQCLEAFVNQRRSAGITWAFAESPQEVLPLDVLGFQKCVRLVEGMRSKLDIPKLFIEEYAAHVDFCFHCIMLCSHQT